MISCSCAVLAVSFVCAGIILTGFSGPNIGIRASRQSGEVEEDDAKDDRGSFNRFRSRDRGN